MEHYSPAVAISVLSSNQVVDGIKQRFLVTRQSLLRYQPENERFELSTGVPFCRLTPLGKHFGLEIEESMRKQVCYFFGSFYHPEEMELMNNDELVLSGFNLKIVQRYSKEWDYRPWSSESDSDFCRICGDPASPLDPLLSLCLCSGDTKYIHLTCLRNWNRHRNRIHRGNFTVLRIKPQLFMCEICKGKYMDRAMDIIPNIIGDDFDHPAVLISVSGAAVETMHFLVNLSDEITIGKGTAVALKLIDARLSDVHCSLRAEGSRIFVRDMNSRLGTFLRFREEIDMGQKPRITLKFQGQILEVKMNSRSKESLISD